MEPKYLASAENATWQNPEELCRSFGDANITSSEVNQDVYRMAKEISRIKSLWIGLNDNLKEGHFVWSDGRQRTYVNWAPKEPNNGDVERGENCAEYLMITSGTWNDARCQLRKKFLCKKANG